MLPLIIIIVLVIAGIALLCIDRNRNAEMLKDIELLKQTREECASLAHPADKFEYPVWPNPDRLPKSTPKGCKPKQPAKYKGKVIPKGWKKYAVSRMPVAPDAIVSVMYDDGTISPFSPDKAGRWDWEWNIKGGTIIAYKTHEPKNKKRVTIRKKQTRSKK